MLHTSGVPIVTGAADLLRYSAVEVAEQVAFAGSSGRIAVRCATPQARARDALSEHPNRPARETAIGFQ